MPARRNKSKGCDLSSQEKPLFFSSLWLLDTKSWVLSFYTPPIQGKWWASHLQLSQHGEVISELSGLHNDPDLLLLLPKQTEMALSSWMDGEPKSVLGHLLPTSQSPELGLFLLALHTHLQIPVFLIAMALPAICPWTRWCLKGCFPKGSATCFKGNPKRCWGGVGSSVTSCCTMAGGCV